MHEPSPLKTWPDVPTRVLLCRDDRLFPPSFLRRVAEERLEAYRVSIVCHDPDARSQGDVS